MPPRSSLARTPLILISSLFLLAALLSASSAIALLSAGPRVRVAELSEFAAREQDEKAEKKAKKKTEKEAKQQAKQEARDAAKAEKSRRQGGKVVKARVVGTVEGAAERATAEKETPAPRAEPVEADPQPAAAIPPAPAPVERPVAEPAAAVTAASAPAEKVVSEPAKVEEVAAPAAAAAPAARREVKEPARSARTEPVARPEPEPRVAAPSPRPPGADRLDVVRETVLVSEVLLDVLVTDRKGNVIEGLGPEDFLLEEDGETREVTSLVFYGGAPELAGSGVGGERRTDRYFLLFFHDQAQAFPALMAAQLDTGRWARRWIERELQPNDQVAVLGYDVRLKLYQDFTRDQGALLEAVNRAAAGKKEVDKGWRRDAPPPAADSPSLLVNLPEGKELSRQSRRLQQALALVGRAAEGIVGRKNLMLFSVGFGDLLDGAPWHPDPRYYPDMKESLNSGNVAVYSIDLLGTARGNPVGRDINDALSLLSSDTGGNYYWTFTNPLTPMRQVSEDNLGYYLLSYRSEYERGTAGYREVEVKTRDGSLRVRARKGYRYGDGT